MEKQIGKKGYDKTYEDDPGFAERGNLIEQHYTVPLMTRWARKLGGKLIWAGQENQTSFIAEKAGASATPDGLYIKMPKNALKEWGHTNGSEILAEFKSIDPRVAPKNLPRAYHPGQLNFGLGLVRRATKYKPDKGLLTYVDASNLTKFTSFVVPYDEEKFKRQLQRAKRMLRTPWKQLPPEEKMKGGKGCKICPFQNRCKGRS